MSIEVGFEAERVGWEVSLKDAVAVACTLPWLAYLLLKDFDAPIAAVGGATGGAWGNEMRLIMRRRKKEGEIEGQEEIKSRRRARYIYILGCRLVLPMVR